MKLPFFHKRAPERREGEYLVRECIERGCERGARWHKSWDARFNRAAINRLNRNEVDKHNQRCDVHRYAEEAWA